MSLSAATKNSVLEQLHNTVLRIEREVEQAAQAAVQARNARDEAVRAAHAAETRVLTVEKELARVTAERDKAVEVLLVAQAELGTVAADRDDPREQLDVIDSEGKYRLESKKRKATTTSIEWSSAEVSASTSRVGTLEAETKHEEAEEEAPTRRRRQRREPTSTENPYECLTRKLFQIKAVVYHNQRKWEFKCNHCDAVYQVDRTVEDQRFFADELLERAGKVPGFSDVSGHVPNCKSLK